jgi:Glycosyltransferase family 17
VFWNKRTPRLWDTFLLSDELDILECRLTEYADTDVYRHVIVEADKDHQGHRKPLYYAENKERFAPWADRIIHIPVKLTANTNWGRLAEQRDAIAQGLKNAKRDDIVMLSDTDEILSPDGIAHAIEYTPMMKKGVVFNQRHAVFCVDWEAATWQGPKAVLQKNLPKRISGVRDEHVSYVLESGWHLSWLGGPEAVKIKTTQYCHPELTNYIWAHMDRLLGEGYYWGDNPPETLDTKLNPVSVDGSWPRWVREHKCPSNWFRQPSDRHEE